MNALRAFVLSEPFGEQEDHAIYFYRDRRLYGGPGPVRIIPGVLDKSLLVLRATLDMLEGHARRRTALNVQLLDGEQPPSEVPRQKAAIVAELLETPPSLLLTDEDEGFTGAIPGLVRCENLDPALAFGNAAALVPECGCQWRLFKESVSWSGRTYYYPVLLITKKEWLPPCPPQSIEV